MNMTKHTLIALAAVVGVLSLQPLIRAADTNTPAPPAAGDLLAAVRERMQDTARELNLTDEQKEKLQTIIRGQTEKLRALRQDTSLSQPEKAEKFKAIREDIIAEAKKVLTPEQFEKWQAKQGAQAGGAGERPLARLQGAIKELNLTDAQKEELSIHQTTSAGAGYRKSLEGWANAGIRDVEPTSRLLDRKSTRLNSSHLGIS